jgi:hypothetical protein
MGSSIFTYVEQLEMLVFFSGYPLVYSLVRLVFRHASLKNVHAAALVTILPFAYALVGTLYLGLELKNLYPDYTIENIKHRIQQPDLMMWALLSLLFWIPAMSKRQIFSVLHSLVFFFIIVRDLYFQVTGLNSDRNILKNDMTVYTISILLNLAAFVFVSLSYYIYNLRKKYPKS